MSLVDIVSEGPGAAEMRAEVRTRHGLLRRRAVASWVEVGEVRAAVWELRVYAGRDPVTRKKRWV